MENIRNEFLRYLLETIWMFFWITASTIVGYLFRYIGFPETNIVIVYLLGVLMTARFSHEYVFGLIASVLATFTFNYFFTAPYYTLAVNDPNYMITFIIMTITSITTSALTSRVKKSAQEATQRENETRALYQLANRLTDAKSILEISQTTIDMMKEAIGCYASLVCFCEKGCSQSAYMKKSENGFDSIVFRDAANMPDYLQDFHERYYMGNEFCEWPIYGRENRVLGILRIPIAESEKISERQHKLLIAMIESTAIAMDRFYATQEKLQYLERSEQERYRSNLLRAISHDLRTPLSGIMGTCEMIMDMSSPQDPRYELTAGIWQDADWLHSLVENILNLTRLEEGKLALKKQPEAVEEIISSALEHIKKRAPAYDIDVQMPHELLLVSMDAKLIVQVLINLLDNAIKHTKPDEQISIIVKKERKDVSFSVVDHGEGIISDDLPHIFKMFYTSKHNAADAKRGVGLGLPICEAIIQAHNGKIYAANLPDDSGAKFTFILPLEETENE